MTDFFYTKNYVDSHFENDESIDHERIANQFLADLNTNFDDERFEKLLIVSGFIPDTYASDSSEETLFSKLVEALVGEWARRLGAKTTLIKQKSSHEDIKIKFADKIIVCDAKSFRLGRSQAAPNAKDFLKLEDVRKWMERYPNALGGLVTYPCKHEWTNKSDIYQYCSTKEVPTLTLPYKYLAYLLHYKKDYKLEDLSSLWDYAAFFPQKLGKKMDGGNKVAYWHVVMHQILRVTKTRNDDLVSYMKSADLLINECVEANLSNLEEIKRNTILRIRNDANAISDIDILREKLIKCQIASETDGIDKIIKHIKEFR